MTATVSALDQYVEQHVHESMQELARLCHQPSVSAQGRGIRECASLVADLLRSRGVAVQVMETAGHPVVFGDYGTGDRTVAGSMDMSAHLLVPAPQARASGGLRRYAAEAYSLSRKSLVHVRSVQSAFHWSHVCSIPSCLPS